MSEIVWEDPPPTTAPGRPAQWPSRLAPLRERPGEWANFGIWNGGVKRRIERGELTGIEAGDYEATLRDVEHNANRGTLYVRYIGQTDLKAVGE